MNKTYIICLSDIHFSNAAPENQGLVIREFFKDLSGVLSGIDRNDLYCVISGDLVAAGNCDETYDNFRKKFLTELVRYVDIENIICTPGNHDLNRNLFDEKDNKDEHRGLLGNDDNEETFNKIIKENSLIKQKFSPFDKFCRTVLKIPSYDLIGYSVNITPEISIYCLNSALLSSGGYNGFPRDVNHLKVDTSGLYRWASENEGRTKVLVMHHPLNHLSEYAQGVIENILRKDVDVLITGHLHKQDFKQYLGVDVEYCKFCSSPQLFSDKSESNGYSIMTFDGSTLDSIKYRKWSSVRDVFIIGSEFSNSENGIIDFKKRLFTHEDLIKKELETNLQDALTIYNYCPSWVDRILSDKSPHNRSHAEGKSWDYFDIINSRDNLQIVGGPQFGLTSFAHKLLLEAWEHRHEHWMYIDGADLSLALTQTMLERFVRVRGITAENIAAVVVDNISNTYAEKEKILGKIKYFASKARIILINNEDDFSFFDGLSQEKCLEGYGVMYLKELDRKSIRKLTCEFLNRNKLSDVENDKLFERLVLEMMDLNVHRTPVNCIQLLLNFKQNRELKIANRAKILSTLIQMFFLSPDSFYYTNFIDENDCCIIMGALCEHLMRNNQGKYYQRTFTEEEFKKATENIAQRTYSEKDRIALLYSMTKAQVIVKYGDLYEFRFSYWVHFFTAYQMFCNTSFYDYMVSDQKCIYMPDIIEFYSGIDGKCDNLVNHIIDELNRLSVSVSVGLGVNITNPYLTLKSSPNPSWETKTQKQLEEDIMASQMPEEMKDAIADKNYEMAKPYSQAIETVLDRFNVHNMINLSRSASRALRNSNLIDEFRRAELFKSVHRSWHSLFEVLVLLTPALAFNGSGSMGGASFTLSEDFDKNMDPTKRLINVVTAIPMNIISWFRLDVYSEKRLDIYKDSMISEESDDIAKHLNALLIVYSRPKGWKDIISKYIKSIGKNSYYLGDMANNLQRTNALDTMSRQNRKILSDLLIECISKQTGLKSEIVSQNKVKLIP